MLVTRRHLLRSLAVAVLLSSGLAKVALAQEEEDAPTNLEEPGDQAAPDPAQSQQPPAPKPDYLNETIPGKRPAAPRQTGPSSLASRLIDPVTKPATHFGSTNLWERRPAFYNDGIVDGRFDTDDQKPFRMIPPETSGMGWRNWYADGKYYLQKDAGRNAVSWAFDSADFVDFNASVDVFIPGGQHRDIIGFQFGNFYGISGSFVFRPVTNDVQFFLQESNGAPWIQRHGSNLVRSHSDVFRPDGPHPIRISRKDGDWIIFYDNKQLYPRESLGKDVVRMDEIGITKIALTVYGTPDHSVTGVFDNFYIEGKQL
jgi:hypothetical protein